jgi:hypothetical protein
VTDNEALMGEMTNDPKDRHILAAAVRGAAEVLVTKSVRVFPKEAVHPYNIATVSQDTSLLDPLDLRPADVIRALGRQVSRYHREPRTIESLMAILGGESSGCPRFAQACSELP